MGLVTLGTQSREQTKHGETGHSGSAGESEPGALGPASAEVCVRDDARALAACQVMWGP